MQALPPWITAGGATLAKMQLLQANTGRREWEAQGGSSDPAAAQMVNQVDTLEARTGAPDKETAAVLGTHIKALCRSSLWLVKVCDCKVGRTCYLKDRANASSVQSPTSQLMHIIAISCRPSSSSHCGSC